MKPRAGTVHHHPSHSYNIFRQKATVNINLPLTPRSRALQRGAFGGVFLFKESSVGISDIEPPRRYYIADDFCFCFFYFFLFLFETFEQLLRLYRERNQKNRSSKTSTIRASYPSKKSLETALTQEIKLALGPLKFKF